jgi:hypothetical protein
VGSSIGGSGVYVVGTFIMNGGEINENSNNNDGGTAYGGGVYISGTLIMNGGKIIGNTCPTLKGARGGGVYNTGNFTMTDGEISNNSISASTPSDLSYYGIYGGGVYSSGTFTMSGGKISGNVAASDIWISTGGGVCADNFIMNGGTISGNTAGRGGGVYAGVSAAFTKSATGNAIIFGSDASSSLKNTATNGDSSGHAVFYFGSSSLTNEKRNTTAGATIALDSSKSGSAGGWE